jgi:hypothetical protein
MTQKELHNQRLLREAEHAVTRMNTRRHFIKESAMGLGGLALATLFGCSQKQSTTQIAFDPAHPLAPKLPPFPGKAKSVIYLHMAGRHRNSSYLITNPSLQKWTDNCARNHCSKEKDLHLFVECPKCLVRRQSLRSMERAVHG